MKFLLLFLILNVNFSEEKSLKEVVDWATEDVSEVGGCKFQFSIPESCQYKMTPKAKSARCDFSYLAIPLVYKELMSVASGECKGSYGLTMMKEDKETKHWSVGVVHNGKDVAGSGFFNEIPVGQIMMGGLPNVGVNLNKLGFPQKLSDVSFGAAKIGSNNDIWMGFRGTSGVCTAEILNKKASKPKDTGVIVSTGCTNMNLLNLLGQFGGKNLKLGFLEGIGVTILVSSIDVNPKKELKETLKNSELKIPAMGEIKKRSLTFSTSIGVPEKCEDAFCKFLQTILQDDKPMEISGTVTRKSFSFKGVIPFNLKVSDKAEMKDLALMVDSGKKSVELEVNFEFTEPALKLKGSIGAHPAGVQLAASLIGMWDKAFGLKDVSMGNVRLAASFLPPSPVPTAFELGATLYFGKKPVSEEEDERLIASSYIGINTVDVTQNYFYAKVEATMEKVIRAFGMKYNLPKFLKETGFPEGVSVSYTTNPSGKSLSEFGITIPMGLRLYGAFEIIGYKAYGDITIYPEPLQLDLNVTMPVVKLGNVASFRATKDENSGGVNGFVKFSEKNPEDLKIAMHGYLELFGSYRYASLEIDSTSFKVATGGSLFEVFKADISLAASYGNLKSASFSAHVLIEEGLTELSESVRVKLNAKLTEGKSKMKSALAKVQKEKENCKKKLSSDCDKCTAAGDKLCDVTYDACKGVCFFSSSCKKKCKTTQNNCKRDLAKGCGGACLGVDMIGKGLCSPMDAAEATVKATEKTYGKIIKIAIDVMTAPEMFMINEIKFDTELSAAELGTVSASIQMTVLKKTNTYSANVNLKEIGKGLDDEIKKLFNNIYEGVKNIF